MKNQIVHMLIPDDSSGVKIITLANSPGKVFIVPRTQIKELREREESKDPALYFLFGEEGESNKQKLYIGESENFLNRLLNHDANKDFWNLAIVFTGDLNKAKIKFLEHKATSEAVNVSRYEIINKTDPQENRLSEFEKIETLDYFSKIKYILSVFGYPVFETIAESLSDTKLYYLKADAADASAQLLADGSLNVLKGSLARMRDSNSSRGWALSARKEFITEGILVEKGDGLSYVFTKDILFKSPSAAASTITGRPSNGWVSWKDEKGNTMDENLRK